MTRPRHRPTALLLALDGEPLADVLAVVRELRDLGVPVALAGPVGYPAPDVAAEFDAVVDAGAKPAPDFFAAACACVDTPPERCLFVDTDDRSVRGARAAGLSAHRYTGPEDLRYLRAALATG